MNLLAPQVAVLAGSSRMDGKSYVFSEELR